MKFGTYPAYIGGRDAAGDSPRLVHTVTARALLDDTFSALALKRDLDLGVVDRGSAGEKVAGACVVADSSVAARALEAAAHAAPDWAAFPLADRIEIGLCIAQRLLEHLDPLVELLVAEGTPRSAAEGMISGLPFTSWSRDTLEWCAEQMVVTRRDASREMILRRVPDGVVCINPPQNAATVNALNGLTAILAGNTAVIRAPRGVALSCMYAVREIVAPVLDGGCPGSRGS